MSEDSYVGSDGIHYGWCNSCGDEAPLGSDCCDDGEVVQYDDDPEVF